MTGGDSVKMSFRSWMHIPEKKVKISGILFKKKNKGKIKFKLSILVAGNAQRKSNARVGT